VQSQKAGQKEHQTAFLLLPDSVGAGFAANQIAVGRRMIE